MPGLALEGSSEQQEVASAFNDMTGRLARRPSLAAGVRRKRLAPAAHAAHRAASATRGRGAEARDPGVERELHAAERETERLARPARGAAHLARERERPAGGAVALADVAEAAQRALGGARWTARAISCACAATGPRWWPSTAADLGVILDNLVETRSTTPPPDTTVTIEWGGGDLAPDSPRWTRGPGRSRRSASAYPSASTAAPPPARRRARGLGCRWSRRSHIAGAARRASSTVAEGGTRVEVTLPLHPEGLPNAEPAP